MIYTFYSFKGGVGRSMALAAVAYLLAERGLRVLAIDFDLEAPGLERYYFEKDEALRVRERPGLIDLLLQYKRALTSPAEFERASFREWRQFVTDAVPATALGGAVDLMTAGRREPDEQLRLYARAVRSFDWQDFFDNWNGARFFEWLRQQLTRGYDAVLVDSRTGLTEMGGVSAYQLADAAIMLCAANYQNLHGTLAVARDFRSDAVLALRGGRPLELLVIPARLESNHPQRDRFFEDFELTFTTEGLPKVLADAGLSYRQLALPYDPDYAVTERLVGITADSAPQGSAAPHLATVFGRLADALTVLAKDGRLAEQQGEALARLRGEAPQKESLSVADVTKRGAGYDVFLDFDPADREVAELFDYHLESAGLSVARYDVEATLGRPWSEDLERLLAYSQALVILFGASGSSPYRETLIQKARQSRNIRIVPVLLGTDVPDSVLAAFGLNDREPVVLGNLSGPEVERGVSTVIERALSRPKVARSVTPKSDIYPGARPFREDDARFFHGRDQDIAELLERLREHDIIVLSGASGVGKTSLVQAGLIPELRRDAGDDQPWSLGDQPWRITIVDFEIEPSGPELPTFSKAATLSSEPELFVLDSVDSYETDGTVAARRRRLEEIRALIASASVDEVANRKILICSRGSWDDADEQFVFAALAHRSRTHYRLQPLQPSQLHEAIVQPTREQGHLFEGGLVDRLIADAGRTAAAASLVQLALPTLWKERRRGWITNQAYDDVGGISGLVRSRREQFSQNMEAHEARRVAVFLGNLVLLDSRLELVSGQRAWSALESIPALGPDSVALRDRLARERLIVLESDSGLICALAAPDAASCVRDNEIQPELMLWRQRFGTHVESWVTQRTLIQGHHLAEAEVWLATRPDELTAAERGLIEASRAAAAQALQQEEQQRAFDRARQLARDEDSRLEELRAIEPQPINSELRERVSPMLAKLRRQVDVESLQEAQKLVGQLRNAREYEAMGLLVEAISRNDPEDLKNRRLYAQYLIETGRATAAIDVLTAARRRLLPDDPELGEVLGLLGRAHKQLFFEAVDKSGKVAREALRAAIEAYRKPYEQDPTHTWHGINLLALVALARRSGVRLDPKLDPRKIARQLQATVEQIPQDQRDEWYFPLVAEISLGLDDWNEVERSVRNLIADPRTRAYHLASTLRQFTQVWGLDSEPRGRGLLDSLRARLLQLPGGTLEYDPHEVGRLGDPQPANSAQLEVVLGSEGQKTFRWWQMGIARARSVAAIRQRQGYRVGTGFLVRAADLGLEGAETVLVTSFHTLNPFGVSSGFRPEGTEIVFEGVDPNRIYRVGAILWASPSDQLDVCVVRLSPEAQGVEPLPIAHTLPAVGSSSRVYLVGHAGGRDLTFSFQDNELLDHEGPPNGRPAIPGVCRVHYRAPTEGGSSGSPVFNEASWEVIAIHHKGGTAGMPRLNGLAGTYAANEGIAMQSIAAAVRSSSLTVPPNDAPRRA